MHVQWRCVMRNEGLRVTYNMKQIETTFVGPAEPRMYRKHSNKSYKKNVSVIQINAFWRFEIIEQIPKNKWSGLMKVLNFQHAALYLLVTRNQSEAGPGNDAWERCIFSHSMHYAEIHTVYIRPPPVPTIFFEQFGEFLPKNLPFLPLHRIRPGNPNWSER